MSNEHLIDRLVTDLRPVRRRSIWRGSLLLGLVALLQLALVIGFGGIRQDMPHAMTHPSMWWKLGSLALLAMLAAATAVQSFEPTSSPRRGLRWAMVLIGATIAIGWLIDATGGGAAALIVRLDWRNGVECAFAILLLALPMLVTLGLMMRRGAATDQRGTALAVGLTGAAWGAFVFVFDCRHDDPLYIAVWYAAGVGAVVLLARLILPPLTRW